MHGPLFRRALLILGYGSPARRLIPYDNANRCRIPQGRIASRNPPSRRTYFAITKRDCPEFLTCQVSLAFFRTRIRLNSLPKLALWHLIVTCQYRTFCHLWRLVVRPTNLTVAPSGRMIIPASMRAKLGCQKGGKLLARFVGNTIVLEPIDAAVSRAQALVRQYVPKAAGIVDELIAERHEIAKSE